MLARQTLLPQRKCILKQPSNRPIDLLMCMIHHIRHVQFLMLYSRSCTDILASDIAALSPILDTEYLLITGSFLQLLPASLGAPKGPVIETTLHTIAILNTLAGHHATIQNRGISSDTFRVRLLWLPKFLVIVSR